MKRSLLALLAVLVSLPASADTGSRDATDIVRDAINHWRGLSSQGAMTMTIHRPDWERSMSMDTWTQGEKRSLIREDQSCHQSAVIDDEPELDGLGLFQ
jgi:hypothetical protein